MRFPYDTRDNFGSNESGLKKKFKCQVVMAGIPPRVPVARSSMQSNASLMPTWNSSSSSRLPETQCRERKGLPPRFPFLFAVFFLPFYGKNLLGMRYNHPQTLIFSSKKYSTKGFITLDSLSMITYRISISLSTMEDKNGLGARRWMEQIQNGMRKHMISVQ